ncbi:hypothetical protein LINPERPRIM_LOCUS5192, partial [Linum perenne]
RRGCEERENNKNSPKLSPEASRRQFLLSSNQASPHRRIQHWSAFSRQFFIPPLSPVFHLAIHRSDKEV